MLSQKRDAYEEQVVRDAARVNTWGEILTGKGLHPDTIMHADATLEDQARLRMGSTDEVAKSALTFDIIQPMGPHGAYAIMGWKEFKMKGLIDGKKVYITGNVEQSLSRDVSEKDILEATLDGKKIDPEMAVRIVNKYREAAEKRTSRLDTLHDDVRSK